MGDDGLRQYDVGKASHIIACGGDIDSEMLSIIVDVLSFQPHLQHTIEWQLWRYEPVVGVKIAIIIVITLRCHKSCPAMGKIF